MKISLSLILFIFVLSSFAQGVLSIPSYNILYRGYDNKIQLAKANVNQDVVVRSTDVELMLLDTIAAIYRARVSDLPREVKIYVLSKNLKDTLSINSFRVMNLPPPSLFFGDIIDGGNGMLSTEISCKYPESHLIPTSITFEVVKYEIIAKGAETTCKGTGGVLSSESTMWLQNELEKPREDEFLAITILTTIKGPDGVNRKRAGIFYLK